MMMNLSYNGLASRVRALVGSLGVLGAVAIAGCGSAGSETPRGDVSGIVTHQGQPVTEGTVYFFSSETGRGGSAPLDEQGEFTIDGGVEIGPHVVTVSPPFVEVPPGGAEPAPIPKEYPNIPEKYRSNTTSDLTAAVQEGENRFTFELK